MPDRRTFYFTDAAGRTWSIRCSALLGIEACLDGTPVGEIGGEAVRRVLEAPGSDADKASRLLDALAATLEPGAPAPGKDVLLERVVEWVRVVGR